MEVRLSDKMRRVLADPNAMRQLASAVSGSVIHVGSESFTIYIGPIRPQPQEMIDTQPQ